MAGFKAKLILYLLRHRHVLKGQLRQKDFEQSIEAVLKFRETCEKGGERFGKLPANVRVKQEIINMVRTEWIVPDHAPDHKLLFYVHGGGYVSGSCNDHRSIVSKLTLKTGITTMLYEYGLAPEHPYPSALEDSISTYQEILRKGYQPENIIVVGESAGGGLALALLLALRDKNIDLPKAAVAISPWTDLSCSGSSYKTKWKVSLAPPESWNVFSHFYVGKNDVNDPYISPLKGSLEGLPPLFINAGDADELFDDSLVFYEKAKRAGVDITFRAGKGMVHCYPLMAPLFKEATEALDEIAEFIKLKLNA
ncbi:alpha/beta hydrolase [Saccharicrinis sp. FJH2]|uniref:alpha/beta hydrolase n=1 Tax=Saccharicrinis sp. FJH65 TaxID=3344659 RepID=UPI0035F4ECDE